MDCDLRSFRGDLPYAHRGTYIVQYCVSGKGKITKKQGEKTRFGQRGSGYGSIVTTSNSTNKKARPNGRAFLYTYKPY